MADMFMEHHRGRTPRPPDVPPSASGLNRMSEWRAFVLSEVQLLTIRADLDLEIRKRFAQPLAVESGEFPDTASIESRMLPISYEAGLVGGHAPDVAQLMTVATETFIKEFLSTVFGRTRSNGPGDSGSAGFGAGTGWIQTHKYRRQLRKEEAALTKGELSRDKSGLLPIEAKAASERPPLGMADLRLALEIGDCGISSFPIVRQAVLHTYRDGELNHYNDYSYLPGYTPSSTNEDQPANGIDSGHTGTSAINGAAPEPMDLDEKDENEEIWAGSNAQDMQTLNNVLDGLLAIP